MPIISWFGADDLSQPNPKTKTFRVKKTYPKILRKRKRRIERRLDPRRAWSNQAEPMMKAANIHYQMADRNRGINCGGIGAIHMMVKKLGLADEIDARLHLLKRHLPYHESDHVLNLAYNAMLQGVRLQDIELRRNDEAFLDGLGAERIPDPTTSGDFTRRFGESDVVELMEVINSVRQRVWRQQERDFLQEAFIDVDGTIAPTLGECKGGMALSYKGIWGYAPLIVSVANTNEVLYLLNRPGNAASHQDCAQWIDRAIEVVKPHAGQITLRGDTAFTLTGELDRWDAKGTKFIFGMDAHRKVVELAEGLEKGAWKPLERLPRYEILTRARRKSQNVKESIVHFKGYQNKVLTGTRASLRSTTSPTSARKLIGWLSYARTSACKRASRSSSMICVTSFISPTATTTLVNRSSAWPTDAATRRTSSNSSKTGSMPCACPWMICSATGPIW